MGKEGKTKRGSATGWKWEEDEGGWGKEGRRARKPISSWNKFPAYYRLNKKKKKM